jgi:hypothetical protein
LKPRCLRTFLLLGGLVVPAVAAAQVTPAQGITPPDDSQSVKFGVTIFYDYTLQKSPKATDASGNSITANAFNVSRTYINFTGKISHVVNFRITPDIYTVNGNYDFRLKYAFAQFNLDDWAPAGSWIRLGQQQTPWIDYEEGIYRYRFQGTTMVDRNHLLTSSDKGASMHLNFANNYGDVHFGIYNGEGYGATEANNEKSFQARVSVRPLAKGSPAARGLRIAAFVDADKPIQGGDRNRVVVNATFEHARFNAGFDWANATDQANAGVAKVKKDGFSIWLTPFFQKKGDGWEALVRYDQFKPNKDVDATQKETIVGVAYWFPHPGGGASAALMFDYDQKTFPGTAKTQLLGVHGLINF